MGFWDGSGIRWTIRKQSAPCSRQITTSTRHHSSFTAGCSSWRPTSSVKALKAKDVNRKPVGKRLCLDACTNADTFTHVHTDRQHKNIMLMCWTQWHSSLSVVYFALLSVSSLSLHTVKPFDLAALKVGEFTCKFILASFIVENPNYTGPTLKLEINFLH